jgi:hypothetical protein
MRGFHRVAMLAGPPATLAGPPATFFHIRGYPRYCMVAWYHRYGTYFYLLSTNRGHYFTPKIGN